jgi:putative ABC transport system permease protein
MRLAIKNILRKKRAVTCSLIGIIVGVCSVIIIFSVGDGAHALITNELDALGLSGLAVSAAATLGTTAAVPLDEHDKKLIGENLPSVEAVMPLIVEFSRVDIGGYIADAIIWGVGPDAENLIAVDTVYGRGITPADIRGRGAVVVLDIKLSQMIYGHGDAVGKTVSIAVGNSTTDFTVVGVASPQGNKLGDMLAGYIPPFVYLPYTTMQDLYGRSQFDQLIVSVAPGYDNRDVRHSILRLLHSQNNGAGYYVEDLAAHRGRFDSVFGIITMGLSAIGGVSVIVGGFGIMNVMISSVAQRRREIGIKKAVGARNSHILKEFLYESAILSLLGGLLGAAIGLSLSFMSAKIFGYPFSIRPDFITAVLIFTVAVGVVFGVYPARRAARLDPIEALRFEN